jgi:hypothetical protein
MHTGWLENPEGWHLWPDVLELLDTAASRGGVSPWEPGDWLWIALDGPLVAGAATARMLADGRSELKHVAGIGAERWREQMEQQICGWARANGARVIISRGRRGWWPIVRKMGWQMVGTEDGLTLYEKVL